MLSQTATAQNTVDISYVTDIVAWIVIYVFRIALPQWLASCSYRLGRKFNPCPKLNKIRPRGRFDFFFRINQNQLYL